MIIGTDNEESNDLGQQGSVGEVRGEFCDLLVIANDIL
jgi:hypothetical protein